MSNKAGETPPNSLRTVTVIREDMIGDSPMFLSVERFTEEELATLIEPALRNVPIRLGPNALAMLERGEEVRLSGGEYFTLALEAANAIIRRNDAKEGDGR